YIHTRVSFASFFNDAPPTEIYTLSLHDALPISSRARGWGRRVDGRPGVPPAWPWWRTLTGKRWWGDARSRSSGTKATPAPSTRRSESTRLNSSHVAISYAVFCLKKKKKKRKDNR